MKTTFKKQDDERFLWESEEEASQGEAEDMSYSALWLGACLLVVITSSTLLTIF